MSAVFENDDNVFRNLAASDNMKWDESTFETLRRGGAMEMAWAVDAHEKPMSDYISFPSYGIVSNVQTINRLKRFAPANTSNVISVEGEREPFMLLQPINHKVDDTLFEHVFLILQRFKSLLVSEVFKSEWERLGLTGAVFSQVGEMDDGKFIAVQSDGFVRQDRHR